MAAVRKHSNDLIARKFRRVTNKSNRKTFKNELVIHFSKNNLPNPKNVFFSTFFSKSYGSVANQNKS